MRVGAASHGWSAICLSGLFALLGACGPDRGAVPTAVSFRPSHLAGEKLRLRAQHRDAVSGASHAWSLRVAPESVLHLAMAVDCPAASADTAPADCGGAWRFDVGVEVEGRLDRLFEATHDLQPDPEWHSHRVDLAAYANRGVVLRFRAEPAREGTSRASGPPRRSRPIWARPFVGPRRLPTRLERPNVVVVSIDTLRADRLGSSGYSVPEGFPPISPALDRLASEGARFALAISQSPWTTPSHASMLTGQYPSRHRVNQSFGRLVDSDAGPYRGLSAEAPLLARLLAERGWRTVGVAAGGTVGGALGFYHGFDVYQEALPPHSPEGLSFLSETLREVSDVPFFLFVHTFAPHAPYHATTYARSLLPSDDVAALENFARESHADPIASQQQFLQRSGLYRAEVTSLLYDGGVLAADTMVGRLLGMLEELDLTASTLVVVTSDHGEEFGEHDTTRIFDAHCATMFDELLHVPLILRMPGGIEAGKTIDRQVRLVDLAPTILDLLDVPIPDSVQGESLVPLLEGDGGGESRWSLSEATCSGPEQKALRTEHLKYVAAYAAGDERTGIPGELRWERLYQLDRDPGEIESVHEVEGDQMAQLRRALELRLGQIAASVDAPAREVTIDDRLREELRALGYLD